MEIVKVLTIKIIHYLLTLLFSITLCLYLPIISIFLHLHYFPMFLSKCYKTTLISSKKEMDKYFLLHPLIYFSFVLSFHKQFSCLSICTFFSIFYSFSPDILTACQSLFFISMFPHLPGFLYLYFHLFSQYLSKINIIMYVSQTKSQIDSSLERLTI